ncbi:ubiquitin ligase (cullin) of SCF [Malassezia sp. CBS 17886]|nr:ubiquitin ligase (cullin) of SCF [Malassezia sp. CBS 17886]
MASGTANGSGSGAAAVAKDIGATWELLEGGIDVMMAHLTEGMSYERYMQLYTTAYNYCIGSGMGRARDHLGSAQLVGGELYFRVAHYFELHLRGVLAALEPLSGDELLRTYTVEWNRYTSGANFVHRLLIYLNRHWVRHQREEGRTDVHTVYTLALLQWKQHVFRKIQTQNRLTDAVLEQIRMQRDGEIIPSSLVKGVLDSFVLLGIDETDGARTNLDVYRDEFQLACLQATETYYRAESAAFVAQNSVADYVKKAEDRLREEEDRVDVYLHSSTRGALLDVCRQELITAHREILWDQFPRLLVNEMTQELQRLYALLVQVPGGLDPIRVQLEEHVREEGVGAVGRIVEESPDAVDPARYVGALLAVYEENMHTVARSFQGEAGFVAALDKACRVYMNVNPATGTSASRSPELLAKYADSLLKKSSRAGEDASVEDALDRVMIVFKYIEDRDYFQKFYSKFLARRLVTFSSASPDAEEAMIARLKDVCGFEYTSKLQRMFTEIGLSRELNEAFRAQLADSAGDLDFYPLVLANGIWPLQGPGTDFSLPPQLQAVHEQFKRFYASQHSRRMLTWLWHLSSNDVHATYLPRKHIFQTSTYQCAVLLLFNSNSALTFDEIASATRLDRHTLTAALFPLVKSKVLHQLDATYSLNMDFKSKKVRVNLQIPVRAEQKAESSEVAKTVDEDRKVLLQATIVRIMKARKTLRHNLLIPEVISQVQTRFQPKVSDIKKAIDTLIEKEFLQRVEDEKDLYAYVA